MIEGRLENCPNCGAPLSPQGVCPHCGAMSHGFYQGLSLGRVDIARAVEQGLDYYLLLGIGADADQAAIESAYWRMQKHLPPDRSRLPPDVARRATLVEQAGYVLRDQERRKMYDDLRRQRLGRQAAPPQDEAARGLACFRVGRYNDAAKLLRVAAQRDPRNEVVHIQYGLSLLYGSSNLASPEDWRVSEMLRAIDEVLEAAGDSPNARAHRALFEAIDHYDKDRFAEGWRMLDELTDTLPQWYLPWVVSAYWCRREGKPADVLARAERARRLQTDDALVAQLIDLMRNVWAANPDVLTAAARQAAHLLGDGTSASDIIATWR
jgi:curved DNA-binding protein CbpA